MKAKMYDLNGNMKGELVLPNLFNTKIREDIVSKYFESYKFLIMQPYAPDPEAGRKHSASGTISHKRHDWKGHYGKGISRIPRKTMWRRGTNFFWIGAEVSGTRGGRKVHAAQLLKIIRKINNREKQIAMNSAIAATSDKDYLLKRYSSLSKIDLEFPIIIESKFDSPKTKELILLLKKILGDKIELALKSKETRAGKGKRRGRRYKSNAGLLLIKGKEEKIKIKGIEVRTHEDLSILDLYPLGRLTVFTEQGIKELENKKWR